MKRFSTCVLFSLLLAPAWAQQHSRTTTEFSISGRLVNAVNGDIVREAFVQIASTAERSKTQSLVAGLDGSFQFHNLAPGKFSLTAQARGYPSQAFEQHSGFSTAIAVGPDKVSSNLVFRLQPDGSITGRILDEHNEPIRDAQVLLFAKTNDLGTRLIQRRGQTQSDDEGQYHFNHLRPGMFYIAVSAQPWFRRYVPAGNRAAGPGQYAPAIDAALDVAYPLTYYPGGTSPEDAGALVIRPADRLTADFDLTPVQALHLTIRNSGIEGEQRVQPTFRVRVFGEPVGSFVQLQTTFSPGEMEVSGLAPGDYALNLLRFNGRDRDNRAQNLNLQGNGEIDALGGNDLAGIHGKINFDGGRPANRTFLQLRDFSTGAVMSVEPDAAGEFKLQPEHGGRYAVSLVNAPGYAIRAMSATGARITGRTIEFSGTQAIELMVEASQGVATINGTVMDGDRPASGTMVVLVPQDIRDNVSLFRRDQSDSDGTFTLRDVAPGRYAVIAIQNGWEVEWASPEALRPYLAKGISIQVTGRQQLDVKLPAQ